MRNQILEGTPAVPIKNSVRSEREREGSDLGLGRRAVSLRHELFKVKNFQADGLFGLQE